MRQASLPPLRPRLADRVGRNRAGKAPSARAGWAIAPVDEHDEEGPPFIEKWPRWQRAALLLVTAGLCWAPFVTLALILL